MIGADGTYVRLKGEHTGIEVVVDDASGELLGLEIIVSESHDEIIDVIRAIAEDVDAEVLVNDDHGAYQEVVDDTGLAHQLCRHHVRENVEDLADDLSIQLGNNAPLPEDSDLTPEQLETDLEQMRRLVCERPEDGEQQLEKLTELFAPVVVALVQTREGRRRLWAGWAWCPPRPHGPRPVTVYRLPSTFLLQPAFPFQAWAFGIPQQVRRVKVNPRARASATQKTTLPVK